MNWGYQRFYEIGCNCADTFKVVVVFSVLV